MTSLVIEPGGRVTWVGIEGKRRPGTGTLLAGVASVGGSDGVGAGAGFASDEVGAGAGFASCEGAAAAGSGVEGSTGGAALAGPASLGGAPGEGVADAVVAAHAIRHAAEGHARA